MNRSPAKEQAWEYFRQGKSAEEVAETLGRATSTAMNYLVEYIVGEDLTDISPWIDPATFSRVEKAVEKHGDDLLRPLFEALDGQVPYDQIRLVLACSQNQRKTLTPPD